MSKRFDPDAVFTPGGLAIFLMSSYSNRRYGKRPSVAVPVGDAEITIDQTSMTCSDCGGSINPPLSAPARFLAINQALNGGRTVCLDCMDADADDIDGDGDP